MIKAIRQRAGLGKDEFGRDLPAGDAYLEECANDQAKMTSLIRNERRLELCFENKRFWDLRRWELNTSNPADGIQISKNDDGTLTYTPLPTVEMRKYEPYQNFGPIPNTEVLRWSNLKQNKGW